jgi:hypothetical protein
MQRPSYEPFDPQQGSLAPLPFGNPPGGGGSGFAQGQYMQQNFGQQNAPTGFVSRYEVDQSGVGCGCSTLRSIFELV